MDRSTRNYLPIEAAERSPKHFAAAIFLQSLTVSLASALVLLLVFSFVAYKSGDPDVWIVLLSYAAIYISAMAGGAFAGFRFASPVAAGGASGLLYLLVLVLSAMLRGGSIGLPLWLALLLYALVPIAAMAGSFIGSRIGGGNHARHRRSTRKQRRRR